MRLDACLQQTARTSFQGHWLSRRAEESPTAALCVCVYFLGNEKPRDLTGRLLWDGGFWPSFSWGDLEKGFALRSKNVASYSFKQMGWHWHLHTSLPTFLATLYRSINNDSAQLAHIFWKAVCLSYQNSALGELGDLHVRSCWWWGEAREFFFDSFVLKAHG